MFPCPHCEQSAVSIKDKYLLGIWLTRRCRNCAARLSANPIVLAIIDMLYVWNILWFGVLYFFDSDPYNFLYMAIAWLFLDIMNVAFVPLSVVEQPEEAAN